MSRNLAQRASNIENSLLGAIDARSRRESNDTDDKRVQRRTGAYRSSTVTQSRTSSAASPFGQPSPEAVARRFKSGTTPTPAPVRTTEQVVRKVDPRSAPKLPTKPVEQPKPEPIAVVESAPEPVAEFKLVPRPALETIELAPEPVVEQVSTPAPKPEQLKLDSLAAKFSGNASPPSSSSLIKVRPPSISAPVKTRAGDRKKRREAKAARHAKTRRSHVPTLPPESKENLPAK